MLAIYTGHRHVEQTQDIAYSTDRGHSWTKYARNPVIALNLPHFRDPKVFWHKATRRWVMAVALADQQKIRFYASVDLKNWVPLSDFGPAGAAGGEWECPDLFPLSVGGQPETRKWVLKVDVLKDVGGQYFVGEFDGTRFVNDAPDHQVLRLDYGNDYYAAQSWADIPAEDGRRIWLGWVNNWEYANVIPTSPGRGMFSIPRELALCDGPEGLRLAQRPITELEQLRTSKCHNVQTDVAVANAALAACGDLGVAYEVRAEFTPGSAAELGIKVRRGGREETVIGCDVSTGVLFLDRRRSGNVGFAPVFPSQCSGPLRPDGDRIRLHIFVDACSVEVFGNEGRTVLSNLIFPDPRSTGIELYAREGDAFVEVLDVWALRPAQLSDSPQAAPAGQVAST
jgi:fructan beta-fructosidase